METQFPGTTTTDTLFKNFPHEWLLLKGKLDFYLKASKHFKVGLYGEGVFSTQSFFHNYSSTILSAPAFQPTPESQTLFLEKFRAHQYVAVGLKLIGAASAVTGTADIKDILSIAPLP